MASNSLCWDCVNGYASRCDWIGKMKPVWDRAEEEKRKYSKSQSRKIREEGGEYTIYHVSKCKNFEKELRREDNETRENSISGTEKASGRKGKKAV